MRPRFQRSVKFEPRMSEGLCTQMWSILESELLARRGVASSLSKCTTGKPAARSGDSGEPVLSSLPAVRPVRIADWISDRGLKERERPSRKRAGSAYDNSRVSGEADFNACAATAYDQRYLADIASFRARPDLPKDGSACWIDCHCQLENIVQGTWRGGLKSKMALAL